MTDEQIGRLSYPQYLNRISGGNPPRAGRRRFKSSAEARAWREGRRAAKGGH